jgi:probable addiction module antidote protein
MLDPWERDYPNCASISVQGTGFAVGTKAPNEGTFAAPENTSRITGGGQMPRSALYDDLLKDMLKDEARALAYLNAALDEQDPRIFLIALRNVTLAQGGIATVAARSGLNRESLYRALSEKGNPSVQTLAAVLEALGARLGVAGIKRSAAHVPLCSFTAMSSVRPVFSWPNMPAVSALQLMAA